MVEDKVEMTAEQHALALSVTNLIGQLIDKYLSRKRWLLRFVPREDLQGAAWLAVCRCAVRFDECRGRAFTTYVYPSIHRAIWHEVNFARWGRRNAGAAPAFVPLRDHHQADASDAPDAPTLNDELRKCVADGMERLRPVERRALKLLSMGFTVSSAAPACGMREPAFRLMVQSARSNMLDWLKRSGLSD